jgi:endonuclease-3
MSTQHVAAPVALPPVVKLPRKAPVFDGETHTQLVRRARKMHKVLTDTYPDAHCELDFTTPLELLVATILSAQTTDVMVNKVTPTLFAKYPDAKAYAEADREEMEVILKPTGFFRAKTNSLLKLGQALVDDYDGVVPGKLEELVKLPAPGARPRTWCSATRSAFPVSPSTRTSAGWSAGSAGPPRKTRSRSST